MPKPAITRVSSLSVTPSDTNKNNGFYAPELTEGKAASIPADTLRDGLIYYNKTDDTFTVRRKGVWNDLCATISTVGKGRGLVPESGTAIALPYGELNAVEVPANRISGFIYYDSTNNRLRTYVDGNWKTITLVTEP